MNWFKTISIFIFIGWIIEVQAIDRALVVGGGCHDSLRSEMAKETLNVNQSLKTKGWDLENLYGDVNNNKDLKGNETTTFTRENFLQYLKKSSKELKKGDKFLLNIITHGLPSKGVGHVICLGDGTKYNLNDPEIHKLLKEMKKNGVQMGFMDNSCYGGESVDVFEKYGCSMSTQVPQFPSYSTRSDNPQFRFGISSILGELLQKGGDVSMEDLYIESLMKYGQDDQSGLLVFPQMSGDVVGAELGQWGAFYIMLQNGMIQDLDEYTMLEYYQGLYGVDLSSEEKSSGEKTINENVICREKETDHQLNEFMRDFDKVGNRFSFNLRHSQYKDRMGYQDVKRLTQETLQLHIQILEFDNLIDQEKIRLLKLDDKMKQVNDQVNDLLEKSPVSYSFESEFSPDQINELKENGCIISSDKKSVDCQASASIHTQYFGEFNKKSFNAGYAVRLPNKVESIIFSKYQDQGIGIGEISDKIDEKINTVFWGQVDQTDYSSEFDKIAKAKGPIFDSKSDLEKKKKSLVEKFKANFNQMRGIDYLNRSKFFANKKIRNCRSFNF